MFMYISILAQARKWNAKILYERISLWSKFKHSMLKILQQSLFSQAQQPSLEVFKCLDNIKPDPQFQWKYTSSSQLTLLSEHIFSDFLIHCYSTTCVVFFPHSITTVVFILHRKFVELCWILCTSMEGCLWKDINKEICKHRIASWEQRQIQNRANSSY